MNRSGSHPVRSFHHVLVGTGQATGTLIGGLPENESIAVIEGAAIGGTCVNTGCTPTKTLIASARVAHQARRGQDYGVHTGTVSVDFAATMARVNQIREGSRAGLELFLKSKKNVTLLRGWGRFVGPRTLEVDGERLTGERVYLDVGSRSVPPPLSGLDDVPWLDHVTLLELEALPEQLIVIGASYIGLELGQAMARFGAQVTVIEAAERILGREDADVAKAIQAFLEAEGLRFEVGAAPERVERDGDGVAVVLPGGRQAVGSHLLVAAGRRPNTERLDVAAGGVNLDERGYVLVDDNLRTSAEGVYALGDVNGRGAFTHTAVHDAQIMLDQLAADSKEGLLGKSRTLAERDVVYAMFTDPPLGRVGLTEAQARKRGGRVLKATMPMEAIARAKEKGEIEGFVKVLVDAETDRFLGATVLGVSGDEVIGLFALAMSAGLTTTEFRRVVLPHPTVGELMPWVLADLGPLA